MVAAEGKREGLFGCEALVRARNLDENEKYL
jgi:hypothetical protein